MNAFRDDLQVLVAKHVARAPVAKLLSLVDSLDTPSPPTGLFALQQRFTKLAGDGKECIDSTIDWTLVRDSLTGLIWTKDVIGSHDWNGAKKACADYRGAGESDWRLPTVKELLSIVDYSRSGPAVDTSFFAGDLGYTWTSTPDAESPSAFAWLVSLHFGYVYRYYQSLQFHVRAVRAGQQLALLA